MIVLDTDHVSVLQQTESDTADRLSERLAKSHDQIVTTAITVQEQCRSWLGLINRYSDVGRQITYNRRFIETVRFFAKWRILPFDEGAADMFERLRKERVRIATMDLKIASIALTNKATLLSSNLRDFEKVPDLVVEDWLYG